jgi:S-adenosylmethionine synthetase
MRLIIGDRATTALGGNQLDVAAIAVETARAWFRERLRHVDPDRHLRYQVELKPGSEELAGLFLVGKSVLGANDTSAAVGYAPLSETERLVLETEHLLNSPIFKDRFPESGEDVKVMGVRTGRSLALTVAMPLLDRYVVSEADYFQRKEIMRSLSGCAVASVRLSISLRWYRCRPIYSRASSCLMRQPPSVRLCSKSSPICPPSARNSSRDAIQFAKRLPALPAQS